MNKGSSIGTIDTSNMTDQTTCKLNQTNKIKDYFNSEIWERKIMSKKLSKYIADFVYFVCYKWRKVCFFLFFFFVSVIGVQ